MKQDQRRDGPSSEARPEPSRNGRRRRVPSVRQLVCPKHPDQARLGNGRKYFLHLLSSEELVARGIPAGKDRWCTTPTQCWCSPMSGWRSSTAPAAARNAGITSPRRRWLLQPAAGPPDLWSQVAHVDPTVPNPTVGEFTRP